MQILVTGGAGYIGSALVIELLRNGHKVKCLDRFFFGMESLDEALSNQNLQLIRDDIRWFDPDILKNVEVVLDLASLSNDPSGELDPIKTFDINFLGRSRVARASKEYGVRRYILASTCSIYGYQDCLLDEDSQINPLTTYAKANRKAEEDILPLADPKFAVTVLRFATVYGYSKRMRFDLVVNAMVLSLYKDRSINIMKDGTQWRPFVHIRDAVEAYKLVMSQLEDRINGQVFNVGFDDQNYQISYLAEKIGKSLNLPYEIKWYGSKDNRSYRVNFKKFKETVSFGSPHTIEEGALEIFEALKDGRLKESLKTDTVEWYKHIINSHNLVSGLTLGQTLL
jgi:nucleoside-diphosphate-sugar epimerase